MASLQSALRPLFERFAAGRAGTSRRSTSHPNKSLGLVPKNRSAAVVPSLRNRDRKGPYSPSLPHHRAYGSVHGGSDSYALLSKAGLWVQRSATRDSVPSPAVAGCPSRKSHPALKYLQLERSSAILLHRPAHLYYDGLLRITANAANSGAISTAQDSRQTQWGLIYSFWAKGDCRVERIRKGTIVSATGVACRFHRRDLLRLVAR